VHLWIIEQSSVVRWYEINVDIDGRKRAEQKLQEDKRDLRAITETMSTHRSPGVRWSHTLCEPGALK
jgi:hypothetical protein